MDSLILVNTIVTFYTGTYDMILNVRVWYTDVDSQTVGYAVSDV